MKFNKWILGLAAIAAVSLATTVRAQTSVTNSPTPPAVFASAGVSLPQWVSITYNSVVSSGILQATNYDIAFYGTYSANALQHIGGGALAIYNIPSLTTTPGSTNGGTMGVGLALGIDWLGQWSLVSGNVTIKADTHPLANISWLSALPASIKNVTATPILVVGIGQPMSGSSGAATLYDIGYSVKFGHWLGGQFNVGATWGEWMNAGAYSGHREHFFFGWEHGIPHS